MYKIFIPILMILFLLAGCSQKINKYAKPTDMLHNQSLTQTQKTVLKKGTTVKMYFITTYISHIKHDLIKTDEKSDRFIVSAYASSGEDKTVYDNLLFRVNNKKPSTVHELKQDDKLLSLLPAFNPWSRYYLITAPIDDSIRGVSVETGIVGIGSTKMEFHDRHGNLPPGRTMSFETISRK